MDDRFIRTSLIFGEEGMDRLSSARVAVFGVGGVGGHCVQALGRAGIGAIDVFDDDVVSVTNINRQAVAMTRWRWLSPTAQGGAYRART